MKYLQSVPGIANGELTITGTRIRVSSLLEMLAAGMTLQYISDKRYPWLPADTLRGALKEAAHHFETHQTHV